MVSQEANEQRKHLVHLQLQEREKAIKKRKEKEKQQLEKVGDIREPVIVSVDELNHRITNITSLSIPKSLQDSELRKMV